MPAHDEVRVGSLERGKGSPPPIGASGNHAIVGLKHEMGDTFTP
jgi:hypothetical protein